MLTDPTIVNIINGLAILVYLAGTIYLFARYRQQRAPDVQLVTWLATAAVLLHGLGAYLCVFRADELRFGVFILPTLFFWAINLMVLLSSLSKPLHNLFVFLFPLSIVAIAAAMFSDSPAKSVSPALMIHVILALLAYALFAMASFQALMLAYQNRQLKRKNATGVVRLLPPLQTMEGLMFELVWAGELLLTAVIINGLLFADNLLVQNQAHTVVFSILAWIIYAVLLWGRHQLGWRGKVAVRWVLGGFVALALAYFGTQLVYQLILQR